MYAFSVASSQLAAGPVKYALQRELMIQPPWDEQLTAANGKEAYILHYTYGQDCDEKTGTPLTDKVRDAVSLLAWQAADAFQRRPVQMSTCASSISYIAGGLLAF
jgi:hypothetical protein